jgi:small subunit ribosomal protein S16
MLAIRMQRTGRKGHAMFRIIVQDARRSPTSGKVVAQLGSYDPHTKAVVITKDKASFYLEHGAQPSERAAKLLKAEGIKLPAWVAASTKKSKSIKNVEKLRRNRPAEEKSTETPASAEAKALEGEPAAAEEAGVAPEAEEVAETEAQSAEAPAAEANPEAAQPVEDAKAEESSDAKATEDKPTESTDDSEKPTA